MSNEKPMRSGLPADCDEKDGLHREVHLRPHHGLCLGFFEGYGYSDGFSQNMAAVLSGLRADTAIELSEGLDCICGNCPNRDSGCPNAAKYDRRVLEACGLTAGQKMTWAEFAGKLMECVTDPGKLEEICGDCRWIPICKSKKPQFP